MRTMNVGNFEPLTRAMGPGRRACLWTRGCSIDCPGCVTPEFIPRFPERRHDVDEVWGWIETAARERGIEGVSFSGGEPFEQAAPLAEIARRVRAVGLSTLAWSGYVRRHIEGPNAPPGAGEFLAALDVLIDGPFVRRKAADGQPLRGSSNQVLHLLTDRYRPEDFRSAVLEASLKPGGGMTVNGVTDYEAMNAVLIRLGLAPSK